MEYRSTNDIGYVHFQGDLVSNVSSGGVINSSHGIQLTGGSTGGLVTAAGDEANVTLNVAAKGTANTRLGNSSSPVIYGTTSVTLSTGSVLQVGSTAPFAGFVRQVSSFATPNFNTTNLMVIETSVTITGANSSHTIIASGINLSTDCSPVGMYTTSTSGEILMRFAKVSTLTVSASSARMTFMLTRF